METALIFKEGCDLTTRVPELMSIPSCIALRYDAGIVKHEKEHTGVIEIYEVTDGRTEDKDPWKSWGGCTQSRTVYHTDGASPTLQAGMDHGNTVPYIVETKLMNGSADGTDSMQNGFNPTSNNERVDTLQSGGGGRLELSRLTDKAGKSNRERRDKPNSDNGEYP